MAAEPPITHGPEVVLHAEQLKVDVAAERRRAVVRRRIITETQQLEVNVRREVLEVEYLPAENPGETSTDPAPGPLVLVLSEEVPVVHLMTRPYEHVSVEVHVLEDQARVTEMVSHEQADLTTTPGTRQSPAS